MIRIMMKINLVLQQEKKFQRSKSGGHSSSSVSSFAVLSAGDLLKDGSFNEGGQIRPILKQSRKNNIFSKK